MGILSYDPEQQAQDLVAVESGEYRLRIVNAFHQLGSRSDSERSMIVLTFEIEDETTAPEVREWLRVPKASDTDRDRNRMNLRLRDFSRSADVDLTDISPEELIGREVNAFLSAGPDDQGEVVNRIRRYTGSMPF